MIESRKEKASLILTIRKHKWDFEELKQTITYNSTPQPPRIGRKHKVDLAADRGILKVEKKKWLYAKLHTYTGSQIPCIHAAQFSLSYLICRLHLWKKKQNHFKNAITFTNSTDNVVKAWTEQWMCRCLPSEIALIKIVKARMKMIRDALPNMLISLLTTCCPIKAAIVATKTKYTAAK